MEEINQAEFVKRLEALHGSKDKEIAHGYADDILCELLDKLGYADVVKAWVKVPKWYA